MTYDKAIEEIKKLLKEQNIPVGSEVTLADRPENRDLNNQVAKWLLENGYKPQFVPVAGNLAGTAEGALEAGLKRGAPARNKFAQKGDKAMEGHLHMRVTLAEKRAWVDAARKKGLKLCEWVREVLNGAL